MPGPNARPGRMLDWVIGLLVVVVIGLAALYYFRREPDLADAAKIKELTDLAMPAVKPSENGDWPQWRGPFRDGIASATGLNLTWPEAGLTPLWSQPTGEGFASVVVSRGRAFTLFQEGSRETLACWNADTGQELWRQHTAASYKNQYGNGPRATPTIAGEMIFTLGGTGILTCVKAFSDTPEVVWSKDLLAEFGADNLKWGVSWSPLVQDGVVYIMPGGPDGNALAALDAGTGALVWKAASDPASYSSPMPATFHGVPQIVFLTGQRLVGMEPRTGKLLCEFPWQAEQNVNAATPIILQNYVFVSTGYNKGCAMVKIDKTEQGWQASLVYKNRKLRSHFASPVRLGDHVYGYDDTNLVCLELRTGNVAWKERSDLGKGSLLAVENHLILFGDKGTLALATADPKGFAEKARFTAFEEAKSSWSVPALANGKLYVRDQRRIHCYELRK